MLQRNEVRIRQERPARKEPLADADADKLLGSVSEVVIARGRKVEILPAAQVKPDMLKGPSGKIRAPLLIRGKKMLVGFSAETLEAWFE